MTRRKRYQGLRLDQLTFGDAKVVVPSTADIARNFLSGPNVDLLQDALEEMYLQWDEEGRPKWKGVNNRTFTFDLDDDDPVLRNNIVEVHFRENREWAIYKDHHARHPYPSPFVRRQGAWPKVTSFTIELARTPQMPTLVRAYVGEDAPPLPWMGSALEALGGIEASREFWEVHAYIATTSHMASSPEKRAPLWFTDYEQFAELRRQRNARRKWRR